MLSYILSCGREKPRASFPSASGLESSPAVGSHANSLEVWGLWERLMRAEGPLLCWRVSSMEAWSLVNVLYPKLNWVELDLIKWSVSPLAFQSSWTCDRRGIFCYFLSVFSGSVVVSEDTWSSEQCPCQPCSHRAKSRVPYSWWRGCGEVCVCVRGCLLTQYVLVISGLQKHLGLSWWHNCHQVGNQCNQYKKTKSYKMKTKTQLLNVFYKYMVGAV